MQAFNAPIAAKTAWSRSPTPCLPMTGDQVRLRHVWLDGAGLVPPAGPGDRLAAGRGAGVGGLRRPGARRRISADHLGTCGEPAPGDRRGVRIGDSPEAPEDAHDVEAVSSPIGVTHSRLPGRSPRERRHQTAGHARSAGSMASSGMTGPAERRSTCDRPRSCTVAATERSSPPGPIGRTCSSGAGGATDASLAGRDP
jgi:hypothetical protein